MSKVGYPNTKKLLKSSEINNKQRQHIYFNMNFMNCAGLEGHSLLAVNICDIIMSSFVLG